MSEWKDISTAPKDGTVILLWGKTDDKVAYCAAWWDEDVMNVHADEEGDFVAPLSDGYERCVREYMFVPTHWMPLPPPPKGGE